MKLYNTCLGYKKKAQIFKISEIFLIIKTRQHYHIFFKIFLRFWPVPKNLFKNSKKLCKYADPAIDDKIQY